MVNFLDGLPQARAADALAAYSGPQRLHLEADHLYVDYAEGVSVQRSRHWRGHSKIVGGVPVAAGSGDLHRLRVAATAGQRRVTTGRGQGLSPLPHADGTTPNAPASPPAIAASRPGSAHLHTGTACERRSRWGGGWGWARRRGAAASCA